MHAGVDTQDFVDLSGSEQTMNTNRDLVFNTQSIAMPEQIDGMLQGV